MKLESLTVENRRKLEKKIALIDAEMVLMQRWLDEDKGTGSNLDEVSFVTG
jgi:hypothetical protein